MEDTGWRRNKYGGWFNVNDIKNKTTNEYMNELIRSKTNYKLDRKENKEISQEELTNEIIDTVNNGQVIDFSVGPTMTICSVYENGDYTALLSKTDSPMFDFERTVVPNLKDKFVVVDDNVGKIPRSSRFKKYGYEVVGKVKKRKRNISGDGNYTKEPFFDDEEYGDNWILMRKKNI